METGQFRTLAKLVESDLSAIASRPCARQELRLLKIIHVDAALLRDWWPTRPRCVFHRFDFAPFQEEVDRAATDDQAFTFLRALA